jgi:hypothetical protein
MLTARVCAMTRFHDRGIHRILLAYKPIYAAPTATGFSIASPFNMVAREVCAGCDK